MPKKGENFWISLSMKIFKSGNWVPKLGAIMRNILSGFWMLIFSLLPPDGCKFLEVDVLSLWARSSVLLLELNLLIIDAVAYIYIW